MKRLLLSVILFSIWTVPARAWNCSNPLASRVDVGSTKPAGTTAGDGDGQYYIGLDAANKGDYYVCQVPKTPTTPKNGTKQKQQQNQTQSQNQTQTANGGNSSSSATGGTSVLKNSGNSTLSNVGNSSNTNTNTNSATGGQGGSANSNSSSASSAQNNGNGSNNASYNSQTTIDAAKIPVNTAYAPTTIPTMSCFKTYSGGAQTVPFGVSIGGGKVDENCRKLETAVHAPNQLVFCKVYITTKDAKAAGVTLQDCLGSPVTEQVKPVEPVIQATPAAFVQPAPQPTFHTESVDHTADGGDCTLYHGHVGNVCTQVLNSDKLKLEANQDAVITVRAASLPEAQIVTKYLIANDIPASRISDPTITGKNLGYVGFSIRWTSTVSVAD